MLQDSIHKNEPLALMAQSNAPDHRKHHTSKQFELELADIKSRVFTLGGLVESQIERSVRSMVENNTLLAEQVIRDDHKVNALEVSIDEECTQILARRQPAAGDLRLVVAVIKAITDLERIGDDAKRIARCTLNMAAHYPKKQQVLAVEQFGKEVVALLKDALDAMARLDAQQALRVKQNDQHIDQQYRKLMQAQIANMSEDARAIPVALNLMWASKALERIADRACNICEYVIYFILGKDIRHMTLEQAENDLREAQSKLSGIL